MLHKDPILRGRCDQSDLLFYNFSIAQYYDLQRTKRVRLAVEPDSTPVRDILVAPIRFIIDINKLHFPGIKLLISV